MRKIVCLATSPWYPIPTRKQQVMSRIPDAEILYFDPSITYIAPMKDKAAQPALDSLEIILQCKVQNRTLMDFIAPQPLPCADMVGKLRYQK